MSEILEKEEDDVKRRLLGLVISLIPTLVYIFYALGIEPYKIYVYINYSPREVDRYGRETYYTSVAIFPPYPSHAAKRHTALLATFFLEKGFSYRDYYAEKELSKKGYHFLEAASDRHIRIDIKELLAFRKKHRIPYLDISVFRMRRDMFWDMVERST